MPDDGFYTLEVIPLTPFGVDLLDLIQIDVARTLKVKGSLYLSE